MQRVLNQRENKEITGTANELPPDVQNEHRNLFKTTGIAISVLRPSGKARFGEKIYNVIAAYTQHIEEGQEIKVLEIKNGNEIIVDKI